MAVCAPRESRGSENGTGQKFGIEMRVKKSPDGRTSVSDSALPRTTMPAMCRARPARYAAAPTMSDANGHACCTLGLSVRSMVCLNVSAVTGSLEGGENRNPGRIRNVYVRPPCERVGMASAISGRRVAPPAPGRVGIAEQVRACRVAQLLVERPPALGELDWVRRSL